jgi:hypothetical protein
MGFKPALEARGPDGRRPTVTAYDLSWPNDLTAGCAGLLGGGPSQVASCSW